MANELDKTIEELEAEVLSELEEGAHDAPMKSAGKADPMEKPKGKTPNGEVQDTGAPVVDGKSTQAPSKKVAAELICDDRYFWNAGIFIANVSMILNHCKFLKI